MERIVGHILGLIAISIVIVVANLAYRFVISTFFAAGRSVIGKGKFKDNLSASFFGMDEFQMRLVDQQIENSDNLNLEVKQIEIKGKFPVFTEKNTVFIISILDTTEKDPLPVLSVLEEYREQETAAFQAIVPMGKMKPGYGFINWTKIGGILPGFLETAYKGKRKLSIFVRLVDIENPPSIRLGYHDRDERLLWVQGYSFEHNVTLSGYREKVKNRIKAHCIIIKLGVYAALSDNNFDEEEGVSIKKWMYQTLCSYSENQLEIKSLFNETFKAAYAEHREGLLSVSELCEQLNKIERDSYKYEAVELCYDIVAADKKIEPEEAAVVRKITESLNLDYKEIEKIKDKRLIGLDPSALGGASVRELLGINDRMTPREVNSHLRREFQKWNSRLNTLSEGEERDNAQKMLDLIAEVRNDRAA